MLEETQYVKNLENPEYLKIILNGKETLAECFAEIDGAKIRETMQKHHEEQDRLRPCVKKAIEDDGLLQSIFGQDPLTFTLVRESVWLCPP